MRLTRYAPLTTLGLLICGTGLMAAQKGGTFEDLLGAPQPKAPPSTALDAAPVATPTAAPTSATDSPALAPAPGGTNAATLAPMGYTPDDKYKLRAGDKISFQILEDRLFDDKDVPKSLVVADSGEVDVPYIGRVAAIDETSKQLAEEIKTRLEADYYRRATVVLALDVANKYLGRIYVWGQVRNQGAIDIALTEKITASKAILRAGGFADFANKKKVKVVRAASADGQPGQTIELNMVEILEQGKAEKDIPLQPDDFIVVPSRLINF